MERAGSETARKSIPSISIDMMERQAGGSPVTEDSETSGVHACEVCGACFETKRGLSSHARSHLRQLGVAVSDSSGAPIDLLYHLIQERDGKLPFPTMAARSAKPKTHTPKKDSGTKLKIKISNLVKKKYSKSPVPVAVRTSSTSGISSSLLTAVRPLKVPAKKKVPSSHSPLSVSSAPQSLSGSPTASLSVPSSKPLWAPQETDAPLNLTTSGKLDVLPVDPETPPPPKKLKIASSSTSSSSSSTSTSTSPSGGGVKAQRRGDSLKVVSCEFCHEKFKKSQSLASHARCHLRQLGVTEWTVHGSPMATLRDLMTRRGSNSLPKPHTLLTMPPPSTVPPQSPSKALSPSTTLPPLSPTPLNPSSPPVPASPRVPKARKGTRMVVSKPKEEPVEVILSTAESPRPRSSPSLFQTCPGTSTSQITTVPKPEVEAAQMVRCDYCNEMFDSRKALSCHARAHLRQLGVKWSPNASPIDTLYELMLREGTYQGQDTKPESSAGMKKPGSSPRTFTPSPIDFSIKEKTDLSDSVAAVSEATCELCGFDFENRKALASHARAHLRQQGVDWRTNGSPIETLSMWMQQEPTKVAELHKRYMQGDLPHVKKRAASSPYPASDPESSRPGVSRPPPAARPSPGPSPLSKAAGREVKAGSSQPSFSSSHRKLSGQRPASHISNIPIRPPRGCERRPPKHISHLENRVGEVGSLKPPRAGNAPSLMPRPPESSLVKLVGKVYSLKCRFCEEVFRGPLSVQEDWLIHLRQHILNLKQDSTHIPSPTSQGAVIPSLVLADTPQLIGPQAV